MLERIMKLARRLASSEVSRPRLSEVCTRPGTSMLISTTPFGAQSSSVMARSVLAASMGVSPSSVSVTVTVI